MNWQIGKARCRSDEYEAEILATDMGGDYPLLVRYRKRGSDVWGFESFTDQGAFHIECETDYDIIPPRLTLEEAARECDGEYWKAHGSGEVIGQDCMLAALQHYEKMKAEGRVERPCGRL